MSFAYTMAGLENIVCKNYDPSSRSLSSSDRNVWIRLTDSLKTCIKGRIQK